MAITSIRLKSFQFLFAERWISNEIEKGSGVFLADGIDEHQKKRKGYFKKRKRKERERKRREKKEEVDREMTKRQRGRVSSG